MASGEITVDISVDINELPLEHVVDGSWDHLGRYCVGLVNGVQYSKTTRHQMRSAPYFEPPSDKPAGLLIWCSRSNAAYRDDIATATHYLGMDQPIPVPEVIEPPKAKPALAGLGITTGDRYTGRLTEE